MFSFEFSQYYYMETCGYLQSYHMCMEQLHKDEKV